MNEQEKSDAPESASTNPTCWDAAKYESAAGFVAAELGTDVLAWLQQSTPELRDLGGRRVLDLGCGDGDLSERLLAAGVSREDFAAFDSSPEMVAAAVSRGVPARVLDATALGDQPEWAGQFDLVFTNAVLHWVADKARVFAGVRRVLEPGGIFAGECGGGDNVQVVREALRQACLDLGHLDQNRELQLPWHFVSPEEFRTTLTHAGFRVLELHCFRRRPVLPEGLVGWLETFTSSILPHVQGQPRREIWERTAEHARAELCVRDENGADVWHADYTRLRWLAVRE